MLLATSAFALTIPYYLGRTVEALQGDEPATAVPPLAMMMILLALAQAATRIASRVALFNAARMAEYELRSQLFAHLLTLDPGYYREHSTGDVMSRLTNDVQTVRAMWGPGILNIVNTIFMFSVAMVLMLRMDPWLTLWALLPYPSMVILGGIFGRRIYRTSRAVQEQLGTLSGSIQEDLTGALIIKTYSLEHDRQRRFADKSTELLHKNMALTKVRGQLVPVLGAIASLGTVIVLYVGGRAVIDGRITLGDMVQFNSYLALLVWPTLALGWMLSLFQRGMASWRRLSSVLETDASITDGTAARIEPGRARGDLEIRELSYEIDGNAILDRVSLRVPAGTVTAIVGRTGSGKSLLIEAIPRLIDVPPGTVFLDGIDIVDVPLADLRAAVGYAPQEAFLFSTTIAENIAVGVESAGLGADPDERDRAIRAAAVAAGLERDLAALPHGLDTVVGERGITLSGGQRQRVALARALATRPAVLVLDDSLSSVDAETEKEVLGHLHEIMAGRTAILISHRVAAVRAADQIAVLDGGKLVELGSHDTLLADGGVYAELYRTQLEPEL